MEGFILPRLRTNMLFLIGSNCSLSCLSSFSLFLSSSPPPSRVPPCFSPHRHPIASICHTRIKTHMPMCTHRRKHTHTLCCCHTAVSLQNLFIFGILAITSLLLLSRSNFLSPLLFVAFPLSTSNPLSPASLLRDGERLRCHSD